MRSLQRSSLSRAIALAAVVVAVAIAAALALTGSDDPAPVRHARTAPPVTLIGGVSLQQARCKQWRAGSPAARRAILGALAGVVGGPTPDGPATTLTSAEAQRLFDRACARPMARGFLLYELYIRAAGFRSFAVPPPT